jgi:hypothetical protein
MKDEMATRMVQVVERERKKIGSRDYFVHERLPESLLGFFDVRGP